MTPSFSIAAAIALMISLPAFADRAPDTLFGNYTGTGPCPQGAKTCTGTGTTDNLYIAPIEPKKETNEEKRLRGSFQLPEDPQPDIHIALRILRNNGHNCTMEGGAFWSGNRLMTPVMNRHRCADAS